MEGKDKNDDVPRSKQAKVDSGKFLYMVLF